ncbi:hypothetical protein BVRB_3g066680 [Beta vulgaris subsp. vulgaris]|nr:hypothetical protein BVRB_3g066680 [Beta vulgaris subsp. vulgaris]
MLSDEEQEDREVDIGNGLMSFPSLHHSLHTLKLSSLPQLVKLPNWMQFYRSPNPSNSRLYSTGINAEMDALTNITQKNIVFSSVLNS